MLAVALGFAAVIRVGADGFKEIGFKRATVKGGCFRNVPVTVVF